MFTPELTVQKTVSNPEEPSHVIGFEARDAVYGRSVLLLKAEAVPHNETWVGSPVDVDGREVYVLGDEELYAFGEHPSKIQFDADDWEYGLVECDAFKWSDFETFDREGVEVSN
jgi:hypothetical protein